MWLHSSEQIFHPYSVVEEDKQKKKSNLLNAQQWWLPDTFLTSVQYMQVYGYTNMHAVASRTRQLKSD